MTRGQKAYLILPSFIWAKIVHDNFLLDENI